MRRIYRKTYTPPQYLGRKKGNSSKDSPSQLVQPDWDDTVHDLTAMRASPQDLLRRKLSRTSHNQMGMTLLPAAGGRRSAQSGQQQERYTPCASHDASDAEDSDDSYEQQQQHHSPGAGSRQLTAQQLHQHHYQHQQSQPGSASVLAQYACSSAAGSEDDVCQWQSPIRATVQQQHQHQQQRAVLQDIQNSPVGAARHAGSAVRHHKHSSWGQQQQGSPPVTTTAVAGTTLTVEADDLQDLLDKINLLEEQLQVREGQQQQQQPHSSPDLQQQLAHSQQQLASTQQELRRLQDEHRQYVDHTSTLLTQLQTQVQQLLTGYDTLPPLPSLHPQQQQQQQQVPSLPSYSSRLQSGAAADEQQQQQHTVVGTRPPGDISSSSTDRLFEISSFIRRQLQEQEAAARPTEAATAAPGRVGEALWPDRAAAVGDAAAAGSPSKAAAAAAAAGRLAASSSSACSSPSRRKAERQVPPAVADTVALPSYAAMRQGRSRVGAGAGFAAAAAAAAGVGGNLRGSSLAEGPPRVAGSGSGSNAQASHVPMGSPKRLQTTQVPRPLPGSSSEHQQQQQRGPGDSASGTEAWAAPRGLSVKAPTAPAAAAAAVWEAEMSSRRPQQMLVPEEHAHFRMSHAAAEAFGKVPACAASVQLPGDLSALLRDLGLTSLELTAGGLDLEAQKGVGNSSSSGPVGGAYGTAAGKGGPAAGAGDRGGSSSRPASVLVSEGMVGPAAATAGGMLSYSRGDGVLAGVQDVDRGLQEGLPRAAVGRVFTAAGCVPATSGEAGGGGPQPRVLKEQLQGNICFRDHLRAAAAAAGSDS